MQNELFHRSPQKLSVVRWMFYTSNNCLIGTLRLPDYLEDFPYGLQDSCEGINLKMIFV